MAHRCRRRRHADLSRRGIRMERLCDAAHLDDELDAHRGIAELHARDRVSRHRHDHRRALAGPRRSAAGRNGRRGASTARAISSPAGPLRRTRSSGCTAATACSVASVWAWATSRPWRRSRSGFPIAGRSCRMSANTASVPDASKRAPLDRSCAPSSAPFMSSPTSATAAATASSAVPSA